MSNCKDLSEVKSKALIVYYVTAKVGPQALQQAPITLSHETKQYV